MDDQDMPDCNNNIDNNNNNDNNSDQCTKRSFTHSSKNNNDIVSVNDFIDNGVMDVDNEDSNINPQGFCPRGYQSEVAKVASKRNTIAVLETGAGKTIIAVLLIREIGQLNKSSSSKKLIVFLAPTVHLVIQQYEFIKGVVDLEVGSYYGAKGIDDWTVDFWQKEIEKQDVLVMTPQILLDALRKAFVNMEMVSLMVLDECHRATGNHPYTKIMKEFYHKMSNKPKVFGMTASPVVRKGVSSATDCESQISELESLLDSQIYTIGDRTEMDFYVSPARETCRFYEKSHFFSSNIKAKIEASFSKFDALTLKLQGSLDTCYKDMDDKVKNMRKRLSKDHTNIKNCLENLGIICAYEAVNICLENAPNANEEFKLYVETSMQCKYFLEEVLSIIGQSLPPGDDQFLNSGFDYSKALDSGYISPKLNELVQLFVSFGEAEILCLIFVERIITAKVIERFVRKVDNLSYFTVSYLTGTNTSVGALAPKEQKITLESFRSGKINLLFATDVVEEGIHVPNCSYVIRFDLPTTVRSNVQSRGRARQNNSQYIIMLERGNKKQREQLFDIMRSEWSMTDVAIGRDPDLCTLKVCLAEEKKTYRVEGTGASVTVDSSISLIYRYCGKLPNDRYYTPRPTFEFEGSGGLFKCAMKLPPNAAFETIVGPECKSQQLAKQLVCLEACKKLHQLGALDDHLLPATEEANSEDQLYKKNKEASAGAGTTKRKELHGTTSIRALAGSWALKTDTATFNAYKMDFSCNIVTEIYSGFILLTESKLDNDVGNLELDLYLVSKQVRAKVSSCGEVHLNAEQMTHAKCFHELFFNGLFGKLFTGSKKLGSAREFLLLKETTSLWNPSNMYLLLPTENTSGGDRSWQINWSGIEACSLTVEFLKNIRASNSEGCSGNEVNTPNQDSDASNTIHFSNIEASVDDIKERVVIAIHTGKIYSILQALQDSADSPFEGDGLDVSSGFSSFREYFKKKYGIVLKYPGQPMLRLKQSHNPHNLIVNFNEDGKKEAKPRQYIHMPPELLVTIDIPACVLKALYLLPSVMHRIESLLLASQLRQEINCRAPGFYIPSSLILEAITTARCCEGFSLERLELLGDSVLKYAISCHLFLKYPNKHEGQLSSRRSLAVCNSTLHKFGTDQKLQGYIRVTPFDPRRWVAPGQKLVRLVPCDCGVSTLEVPLVPKFQTENPKVMVGRRCDLGHRWTVSKTISDCVEAVIGAYYVSGGLVAGLQVLKWLGFDTELDLSLVDEVITSASLRAYTPKLDEIQFLESKIGYSFSVKFLLQEAMTHASLQEHGLNYCYQRLEFLGDSVLDLLITWYLYQNHTDVDPGELTDLRSACVSNDNFALAAVKRDLYKHLQHCSTLLSSQIMEFCTSLLECDESSKLSDGPKAPKALGDLVESIAGAMLIDTKLNLDIVWGIFKELLSPLVTPEKLELPPLRELTELCNNLGYFVKEKKCVTNGDTVHVELTLQLSDALLVGIGVERSKKLAKGKAASDLLKQFEKLGMVLARGIPKRRKKDPIQIKDSSSNENEESLEPTIHKKQKKSETESPAQSIPATPHNGPVLTSSESGLPVIESISEQKGGPRIALFELCKLAQWSKPTFDTSEEKSRQQREIGEGPEKRKGFSSFVSTVTLNIPHHGPVECTGEARADKKSSFDSAAFSMLHELQRQGRVVIGKST